MRINRGFKLRAATRPTRLPLLWAGLVALASSNACTNAFVEPTTTPASSIDDRLTLHLKIQTAKPDPRDFPIKVLFLIDESGSMCVSDPPGSQNGKGGLCEQFCGLANIAGNVTDIPGCATTNPQPARVTALRQIMQNFQAQNQAITGDPNHGPIQVAIVPFETNVFNVWPPTTASSGLTNYQSPDDSIYPYIDNLQNELGNGTDYQGVLNYAQTQMAADMSSPNNAPDQLPRTRYVVVFLTDGTPYPRCTSTPNLPNADYANYDPFNNPQRVWMDDPASYCEESVGMVDMKTGSGDVTGYTFGTDRNQNYQLFDIVQKMMSLKTQYNVGDIQLDTILLLNPKAVELCGSICQDLYGAYPGLSVQQFSQATFSVASWLLQQMANYGNGVFQAYTNGQIQSISLAGLDYATLAARNVMKTLYVQSLSTTPTPNGRVFDSDGEGLPDSTDNLYTYMTSPYTADSDNDGFDDKFEVDHANEGFDPAVGDERGFPKASCALADTDGDGLSQCAELFLGTNPGLADSDADGIPDGLEVRYGFNPIKYDNFAAQDTDGDGISDLKEFMANTDPTVADNQLYQQDGYQYQITATNQADNSVIYDITVSNLKLDVIPSQTGVDGFNLYKVWFAEAPETILAQDYGVWHVACAWAQYDPPNFRVPAGPVLDMTTKNWWTTPDQLVQPADYLSKCAGMAP